MATTSRKLKAGVAPAQPIAAQSLPSELLNVARDRVLNAQTAATIVDDLTEGDKASSDGGYSRYLHASMEMGFTYQELVNWVQAKINSPNPSEGEKTIRAIHEQLRPDSAPAALRAASDLLQLVVDASTADATVKLKDGTNVTRPVVEVARDRTMSVPKPSDKRDPVAALATLKNGLKVARDVGDKGEVGRIQAAIDAVDDTTKLARMGNDLNAMQTASRRFRQVIFLHLIDPLLKQYAPTKVGTIYEDGCGKALAAHKAFGKLGGQERTPHKLQEMVTSEVEGWLKLKYGVADRMKRTEDEIGLGYIQAIMRSARGAYSHGMIEKDAADAIISWAKFGKSGHEYEDKSEPKAAKGTPETKAGKKARGKAAPVKPLAPARKRKVRGSPPAANVTNPAASDGVDTSNLVSDLLDS